MDEGPSLPRLHRVPRFYLPRRATATCRTVGANDTAPASTGASSWDARCSSQLWCWCVILSCFGVYPFLLLVLIFFKFGVLHFKSA